MYKKLITTVRSDCNKYARNLVLVCTFNEILAQRIGDHTVYISEFVIAKILGYINHLQGHPEVTKDFLLQLPEFLLDPKEILMRHDRPHERYIICGPKDHRVVLEIKRGGICTQINTIHLIKESKLKRLKAKCRSL